MSSQQPASIAPTSLTSLLGRKLLFVTGKGGVGKTVVSRAIAQRQAASDHKTLWVTIQDPLAPAGTVHPLGPNLYRLNCDPQTAFEEYVTLKIGIGPIAKLFARNAVIQYLSKAAPGMTDIVLMGKIWYETRNYDRVVVDMPSTGYGLAMFNSARNYSRIFRSGPVRKDAERMLATFGDAREAGTLIVALPEEMPIAEALELYDSLLTYFPANPASFLVNKRFPKVRSEIDPDPDRWPTPVPASASDYAARRTLVEAGNLEALRARGFPFVELELVPAGTSAPSDGPVAELSRQLATPGGAP